MLIWLSWIKRIKWIINLQFHKLEIILVLVKFSFVFNNRGILERKISFVLLWVNISADRGMHTHFLFIRLILLACFSPQTFGNSRVFLISEYWACCRSDLVHLRYLAFRSFIGFLEAVYTDYRVVKLSFFYPPLRRKSCWRFIPYHWIYHIWWV